MPALFHHLCSCSDLALLAPRLNEHTNMIATAAEEVSCITDSPWCCSHLCLARPLLLLCPAIPGSQSGQCEKRASQSACSWLAAYALPGVDGQYADLHMQLLWTAPLPDVTSCSWDNEASCESLLCALLPPKRALNADSASGCARPARLPEELPSSSDLCKSSVTR